MKHAPTFGRQSLLNRFPDSVVIGLKPTDSGTSGYPNDMECLEPMELFKHLSQRRAACACGKLGRERALGDRGQFDQRAPERRKRRDLLSEHRIQIKVGFSVMRPEVPRQDQPEKRNAVGLSRDPVDDAVLVVAHNLQDELTHF
ncbi:MAG: hypothetical protein ABSC94_33875, partial [Polyangiaceae bacterium]